MLRGAAVGTLPFLGLIVVLAGGCDPNANSTAAPDPCSGGKTHVTVTIKANDGAAQPITALAQACFSKASTEQIPQGSQIDVGCSNEPVRCLEGAHYCMTDDISSSGCSYFTDSWQNPGYSCVSNGIKYYSYGCVVAPSGEIIKGGESCYPAQLSNGMYTLNFDLTPDEISATNGNLLPPVLKFGDQVAWGRWISGSSVYDSQILGVDLGNSFGLHDSYVTCDPATKTYQADGTIQFIVF